MKPVQPRTGPSSDGWRSDAACRGLDTNLFFPPGSAGKGWVARDEVQRICDSCPVRSRCLQWALDADVTDGIWGGLTPLERREQQRSRRRARRPLR